MGGGAVVEVGVVLEELDLERPSREYRSLTPPELDPNILSI